MPKSRNKDKKKIAKKNATEQGPPGESDDETKSEISTLSVGSDQNSENSAPDNLDDGIPAEEVEDKIKEAIDGLTEKSAQHRLVCLKVIIRAFSTRDMDDILENLTETLVDSSEKCVKKGKPEERALAAQLLAMISIQCGPGKHGEELFHRFKAFLVPVIQDDAVNTKARGKCCETLAVSAFVAADDMDDIVKCMEILTGVFKKSYYKGDGTVPSITPAVADLHKCALSAWSLLMSICPWSVIADFVKTHFPRLPELLESHELSVRIVAGETLALFYEIMQSEEKLFIAKKHIRQIDLCEKLKELSTDSSKYRAKKDRREQRSIFRDVLRTVQEGDYPDDQIKFGREILFLDSWTRKRQYETLRDVLTAGINFHLKNNELLRDVFALGAPLLDGELKTKRSDRHMYHQAAFKARTKVRGKLRDKRTSAI